MRGHEELIERLAERRRNKLKTLSDAAFEELLLAVKARPQEFIDNPADEAFSIFVKALDTYSHALGKADFIDDEKTWLAARTRRFALLSGGCNQALAIDPTCMDARLCAILLRDLGPDELLDELYSLDKESQEKDGSISKGELRDAWTDVFCHGRVRLRAAIARTCLDSARYRMAQRISRELLMLAPSDIVGARHTCVLSLARLEDEEGFDAFDAQLERHGDSWSHLGRVILLYKLGRIAAARRALLGYSRLVEGGAYALLRPILVDTYLPDRPEERPSSFGEATLAVHEADPIIVDIPDLVVWAEQIPEVANSARRFASTHGYDW